MFRDDARSEDGSATVAAVGLVAALVIGGAFVALAVGDDPAPVSKPAPEIEPQADEPAAPRQAEDDAAEEEQAAPANQGSAAPETHPIDWQGQVATFLCAPSGPYSCFGTGTGDADQDLDTGLVGEIPVLDLSLAWEAQTPATMELKLAVAAGHTECGGDCYYWTILDWIQGTSPLTLEAEDLSIPQGETLWILVDTPDQAPTPLLYSKASLEQPFHVTGTVASGETPQGEESA